jgi:hypothetical protein
MNVGQNRVSVAGKDPSIELRIETAGRRQSLMLGRLRPPTSEEREWARRMAERRTRVPKGIFRYRTMEEANADWEGWRAALVAETVSASPGR